MKHWIKISDESRVKNQREKKGEIENELFTIL